MFTVINHAYKTQDAYYASYHAKNQDVRKPLRQEAAYQHENQKPQMHDDLQRTENLTPHLVFAGIMHDGVGGDHDRGHAKTQDKRQDSGNPEIRKLMQGPGKNKQHYTTQYQGCKYYFIVGYPLAETAVEQRPEK